METTTAAAFDKQSFFSESGLLLIEFSVVTLTSYFSTFDSSLLFIDDHQLAPS